MTNHVHENLPCGVELAVAHLPNRHVMSFHIRVLAGTRYESTDQLGIAQLVEETLDKGTSGRSGRECSDAFDAIGAAHGSGTGRETATFTCTVLPEQMERAVALHAEFLREPIFPQDAFEVNVDLFKQEIVALDDDAHGLADKLISRQAFGPVLGRHPLGEAATLDPLTRDDLVRFWKANYCAGRVLIAAAGPLDPRSVADLFEQSFAGFGSAIRAGREAHAFEFTPQRAHHHKDLEQQQIQICWPGVDATHADFPTQQILLGVLSGGMSGRLFTEVREKQGLVYWVSAWQDTPRGAGMIFLGASTTPERCEKTYVTLLSEVERLREDATQEELDRAITGIVASHETHGDSTRAQCSELLNDLFFYGRPIPTAEKLDRVRAVTVDDLRRYLETYPRDRLCVLTLGPRPLDLKADDDLACAAAKST